MGRYSKGLSCELDLIYCCIWDGGGWWSMLLNYGEGCPIVTEHSDPRCYGLDDYCDGTPADRLLLYYHKLPQELQRIKKDFCGI